MSIQPVNSQALSRPTPAVAVARQSLPESTSGTTSLLPSTGVAKTAQTAPQEAKSAEQSRSELEKAVKDVSEFVKTANNSLQFSIDDDLGVTVVKVIDTGTKEIIRQIPSEEMLSIAKALGSIKGLLVQQKA